MSTRRAILSVTNKDGLADLAGSLTTHGYELIASGGTAAHLRDHGYAVTEVAEITGQPEILGGRVKTLHPSIAAGILAPTPGDLEGTGFAPIDVVVVNLYDFGGALARNEDEAGLVEAVDIGGPTLLRAAAKNFERVTVLPDPKLYPQMQKELEENHGTPSRDFRKRAAGLVMKATSDYDASIAAGLFGAHGVPAGGHGLRYGENPHQVAWWGVQGGGGLAELGLLRHGGKELSYNNLLDLVAALKLAGDLPPGGCAILKHTNPCGVGLGTSPADAFDRALACDPTSAFGGIVAFSDPVDGVAAEKLAGMFLEVIVAPDFTPEAREQLAKKKNLRWLSVDRSRFADATRGNTRSFGRLVLGQSEDDGFAELARWQHVAGPAPSDEQISAARLAWIVSKHVKSNAIVLASATATLGIGAGQMSRVDSCQLAVRKAQHAGLSLPGCAAASDGFFPFPDGLETLADAGATTVIQPGGSIKDDEVVAAADARGVSLCLTGVRHFRH